MFYFWSNYAKGLISGTVGREIGPFNLLWIQMDFSQGFSRKPTLTDASSLALVESNAQNKMFILVCSSERVFVFKFLFFFFQPGDNQTKQFTIVNCDHWPEIVYKICLATGCRYLKTILRNVHSFNPIRLRNFLAIIFATLFWSAVCLVLASRRYKLSIILIEK